MKQIIPVRSRIFRTGKLILTGIFVLIASVFFLYPQVFYCEFITFSSFRLVSNDIYLSPELGIKNYQKFARTISRAEARVDSFYQGRKASSTIIICSNAQQYRRYCSSTEGEGCSLGTPWGSSFVVLNAQGMNADVIAHELSHTELLARVGWWKATFDIPQWFNEGVALMLDRRFVRNPDPAGRYLGYMDEWLYYTGGGQQVLELKELESIKGFYKGDQEHVMLAYMTSGMEVAHWQTLSGKEGMQTFMKNISLGQSFQEAYQNAELPRWKTYYRNLPTNPLRIREPAKMVK